MKKAIQTPQAPPALGPYSQALLLPPFLFVSGQLPIDPATGKIEESSIEGQTRRVLLNIQAILESASLSFEHVVKVEVFLKDLTHFHVMNELYALFFKVPPFPARQTIQAARLPLDSLIEISCIAFSKQES